MANSGNQLALKRPSGAGTHLLAAVATWVRWIAWALVFIAVAIGGAWLVESLRAEPITSVRIVGAFRHVSHQRLEAAIAPTLAGGFFGVDVEAVRAAAMRLPWVREASVRRVWPGEIHVSVVERKAAYRWGEHSLLEADGTLFTPGRTAGFDALPELDGPSGTQEAVLEAYAALTATLRPTGLRLRALSLSRRGSWRARLSDGIELILGASPDPPAMARLASIFDAVFQKRSEQIAAIDLRYTNGFAVRWKQPAPSSEVRHGVQTQ